MAAKNKQDFDKTLNELLGREQGPPEEQCSDGSRAGGTQVDEEEDRHRQPSPETILSNDVRSALDFLSNRKYPVVALFIFSTALLLFPPFVYNGRGYSRVYVGHHFIFNPPSQIVYIDFVRIAAYWLLGALLCAAWYFSAVKKFPAKKIKHVVLMVLAAIALVISIPQVIRWDENLERKRRTEAIAEAICKKHEQNIFVSIMCQDGDYAGVIAWEADRRKKERDGAAGRKTAIFPGGRYGGIAPDGRRRPPREENRQDGERAAGIPETARFRAEIPQG